MLARKYYAQRNNNPIHKKHHGTTSTRINALRYRNTIRNNEFVRIPENTQNEYIQEKRVKQVICNGETNVTPKQNSCANGKVCNVTKDLYTITQNEYIENYLPEKCVLNEPKKPLAKNVC